MPCRIVGVVNDVIIDDLSRDSIGIIEFVFVVGQDDVAAIKVCDTKTATGVVVSRFSTTDLIRASSVAKATGLCFTQGIVIAVLDSSITDLTAM